MKLRRLGESDLMVSEMGLGTMTFGQQNDEAGAHAQLDLAYEHGINLIDAAEMYPVPPRAETCGATERIVGNWLVRKPRDRVVLATKVAGPARSLNWIRGGPVALDRANIRAALEGSLQRLRTDYIDLYQLHWPERNQPMFGQYSFDPSRERAGTPIEDQLAALAELVKEGKIRYVGLSNEHPWGVCRFIRLAEQYGLPRVVSVQNAYNLLNRVFECGLAEVCYREHVGLLAYSPLAFGHLSGKYLADAAAPGRVNLFPGFGQRYEKVNVVPASRAYAELARHHGLSPAVLALAFVCGRSFVASALIGATSVEQLGENMAACSLSLAPELLEEIERIHLRYTNPAP
jgi:aryl-alcohol dehydrogenase-like predicted oxidoreductase